MVCILWRRILPGAPQSARHPRTSTITGDEQGRNTSDWLTKALWNISKKWSDGREQQKDRECPWLIQARAHRSGPIGSPGLNITSVSVGPTYITAMQLRPRVWKLLQVYFYPSQIKEIPSDLTSITPDESHHFSHASTQFDNDMRPSFVPPHSSSWYINGKIKAGGVHTW